MDNITPKIYREYHIFNPAAGHGKAPMPQPKYADALLYQTKGVGDAQRFVMEVCQYHPQAHFFAYGGDGTLHEVVNGIAKAGALATAKFTPVPAGSGNDFVRILPTLPKDCYIDLLRYNDNYALNMINIGFDCHVADRAASYKRKPLISGSAAYIAGIVSTLCHKMGHAMTISYIDENGKTFHTNGEFLLTVAANGRYCGGGFYSHPTADLQDGLMDVLLVKKISRRQFIALVPYYKKGTHLTPDGKVAPRFEKILRYIQCKEITVEANDILCADGEIEPLSRITVSVLPRALHLIQP